MAGNGGPAGAFGMRRRCAESHRCAAASSALTPLCLCPCGRPMLPWGQSRGALPDRWWDPARTVFAQVRAARTFRSIRNAEVGRAPAPSAGAGLLGSVS